TWRPPRPIWRKRQLPSLVLARLLRLRLVQADSTLPATLARQSTTSESQSAQTILAGGHIRAGGSASLTSGDAIRIEGSNVNVAENLQLDSALIDMIAGRNTSSDSSSTRQNSQSVTASYGSQGSGSFQTGLRTSSSDGQSLT